MRRDIDAVNRALLDALARLAGQPAGGNFHARAEQALGRAEISERAARLATAPLRAEDH